MASPLNGDFKWLTQPFNIQLTNNLRDNLEIEKNEINLKKISLSINSDELLVTTFLTLPASHSYSRTILFDTGDFSHLVFNEAVGDLLINTEKTSEDAFLEPETKLLENSDLVQAELISKFPISGWTNVNFQLKREEPIPVEIKFDGSYIRYPSVTPNYKNDDTLRFNIVRDFSFVIDPVDTEQRINTLRSNQDTLILLSQNLISFNILSSLLFTIFSISPILLFYIFKKDKHSTIKTVYQQLKSISGILILFHFSLGVLGIFTNYTFDLTRMSEVSEWLSNFLRNSLNYPVFHTPILGQGISYLLVALLGITFPNILKSHFKESSSIKSFVDQAQCLIFLVLCLSISGLGFYWLITFRNEGYSFGNMPVATYLLITLGGVLIILCYLIKVLLGIIYPIKNLWLAGATTALGCASYVALYILLVKSARYFLPDHRDTIFDIFALTITAILGANLVRSFLCFLCESKLFPYLNKLNEISKSVFGLVIYLLVLPKTIFLNPEINFEYSSSLIVLGYQIDNLLIIIWVSAVLFILYKEGKKEFQVNRITRWIGILAASSLMYSIQLELVIPVTFIIGLLLLNWVVRPATEENSFKIGSYTLDKKEELIQNILNEKAARISFRNLWRSSIKKLSEGGGDYDYSKFKEEISKQRQLLNEEFDQRKPPKYNPFATPPFYNAWDNGVYGTKCAFILGLPWILIGLIELLTQNNTSSYYPEWQLVYKVSLLILKWLVIGFIFGYFYTNLRGNNGLEKAAWLAFAAIFPSILVTLITSQGLSSWQPLLFWSLQVFIHCMLIGLVGFELSQLYRIGYRDWRYVFDIHGMPTLGISISSIIAAVGLTITTLISSQATEIVSRALQLVFPDLPEITLPKAE
jgi:hypothetical protein